MRRLSPIVGRKELTHENQCRQSCSRSGPASVVATTSRPHGSGPSLVSPGSSVPDNGLKSLSGGVIDRVSASRRRFQELDFRASI